MSEPVIVIGGGGHAGVVADVLRLLGREIFGICDPALPAGRRVHGVDVLGDDAFLRAHDPASTPLANGIGSTHSTEARARVFREFSAAGFRFVTLAHPAAAVAASAQLEEGVQVMAGAVVQPGAVLEENVLVNTRASVDHDCRIGRDVHIAPGVVLSGCVSIGAGTHVGPGAVVVQGVRVGTDCHIGAGCLVTGDLGPRSRVRAAVPRVSEGS